MTREAPSTLAPAARAGGSADGRNSTGVMPTRAAPGQLVVRAVADEEAVGRLDARAPGRAQVDLRLRLHQAAVGREGLRVEETGELGLGPRRRHLLGADRDQAELQPRGAGASASVARRPRAAAGRGGRTRAARRRARRRARPGRRATGRRRRAAPSARRGSSPASVASNSSRPTPTCAASPSLQLLAPPRPATRRACPRGRRSLRALAQHLPGDPDVLLLRARVADREPDHALAARASSSRRRSRRSPSPRRASSSLSAVRCRKQTVEKCRGADTSQPGRRRTHSSKQRREPDVLADQRLQAVAAVAAQHRPELERAEAPAERRARSRAGRARRRSERGSRRGPRTPRCSASGRRVQSVEQSIGVKSHLCGLTTIESARSTPSRHQRSSGQTAAEPA